MKAKIAKNLEESKWISYKEYIHKASLVDIDYGLTYFSRDRSKAIALFIQFMNQENQDKCLDDVEKVSLSDDEVRDHIGRLGISNSTLFQQLNRNKG